MVQSGVRLFTGVNFSNVLAAVAPAVLNAGGFYVSLNAAPSNYAGRACNPNYFSVAFQNDSYADTAGMAANDLGARRVVVMAPNYQAGRDAVAGFKRAYKGEIVEEIYTKLDQSDFSVELARIRSLDPDALFQFHPGGAGINLTKQFANSGLAGKIKMITPIYSMDDRMLAATGSAGKGFYLSSLWSADLDNPQNKHFVDAFTKAYKRAPTAYAAQAYDTANLIGSGLKAVGGDIAGKPDAFRDALRRADFPACAASSGSAPTSTRCRTGTCCTSRKARTASWSTRTSRCWRATTPTCTRPSARCRSRQDRRGGRQMRGGTVVFGTFRIA